MDYFNQVNKEQADAIKCTEGPVMIIAGAGSGKTRVLTYRISHLINKGVEPFGILSLTFTNKAAREMRQRIEKLIGTEARNIWMGTFHSIFARILRYEANFINYPNNFTIYDSDDSKSLMKSIIKEQNLNDMIYKAGIVLNRISLAKNNLISYKEYKENSEIQSNDYASGKPKIGMLYEIYQKRCRKANAMDFDDLLFNTYNLLKDFPDCLYKYQNKFKYLMVDEFQDTNFVQYAILKKLAAQHENICVVGDDAQSIYAFRGASIQNILSFQKDYPDCSTFKLEQNYRSTKVIVEASGSLINHNKNQLDKKLWTQNDEGKRIKLIKALTDNEEGRLVSNMIFEEKMNSQLHNYDFAILYRTNAQSRALEEALRKLNIKYKIYGGFSFYQRKEVKDLLAYLRLTVNSFDEEALKRVINYPARGIGKTSIEKIIVLADQYNKPLWEILETINNYDFVPQTKKAIEEFSTMIKSFHTLQSSQNAFEITSHIAQSSGVLKELYSDKTIEGLNRYENIHELMNGIKEFTEENINVSGQATEAKDISLNSFLQEVSLLTNQDNKKDEDLDHVSLMTIHMAKGLEFKNVFVAGLEEELFPSHMSLGSREELEEERRLFYVAMTRAENLLTISYAENRYKWGTLKNSEPSRFISEIDEKYLEYVTPVSVKNNETGWGFGKLTGTIHKNEYIDESPIPVKHQLKKLKRIKKVLKNNEKNTTIDTSIEDNYSSGIQAGMKVNHLKFGEGKVLNIDGSADNQKATIFFQGYGQKQLLLKYAKLNIVE